MKQQKKVNALKPKNSEMAAKYPMNIDKAVWDVWQLSKKKNDAKNICKETQLSRPIIDRALNYGHINNETLESQISAYFLNRKTATVSDVSKQLIESK